jgi:hypothetical protein
MNVDLTYHGLSPRSQRIAVALATWPRKRVQLTELWRILDDADPASRGSAGRRTILFDALTELTDANVLSMPGPASWDRIEKPHLPRFVTVPTPEASSAPRRRVIWHPALAWVSGCDRFSWPHCDGLIWPHLLVGVGVVTA